MSKFLDGLGAVFEKVTDFIPGRKESKLNRRDEIKEQLRAILAKKPFTSRDSRMYTRLSNELSDLEKRIERIK